MTGKPNENRLEIRSPKFPPGERPVAFGNELEITLNGERLNLWQRVSLDLRHDHFVFANIEIALSELVIDAEAALILEAAAKRVTIENQGEDA